MRWPFRPAPQRPVSLRDPEAPCKYCTDKNRWRMELWGHVIYVCEAHVDQALDEYMEIKNGKSVSK